jgi:uncharacterized protein YoxC
MNTMITLGDACLVIIAIALTVLIFYCISLVRNLVPAVKTLNRILEDTERITTTAADGVDEARKAVCSVGQSVSLISDSIKGKEGTLAGMTSLVKAISSLVGLLKHKKD